jgi:hypothetical protein
MPLIFGTATTSDTGFANPFVGTPGPTVQLKVDVSALEAGSAKEVSAYGILKPGMPFAESSGLLIPVGSGNFVYGVVMEPIQLAAAGASTGAVTTTTLDSDVDQPIAVCVSGVVNRDIIEDNLGRALTADEIAGFDIAGSHLRLTET